MNGPQTEMPKYRCHKEVHALKIKVVGFDQKTETTSLEFEEPRYAPIAIDEAWMERNPKARGGGYYVVYKDGYSAYSPAEAFEDGYTLIPSTVSGSP